MVEMTNYLKTLAKKFQRKPDVIKDLNYHEAFGRDGKKTSTKLLTVADVIGVKTN